MVKLEYFKEAVKTSQAIYADKTRAFLENKYPGFFPDIYDQLKKEEEYFAYIKICNSDTNKGLLNFKSQNIKFLGLYDVISSTYDMSDEESAVEDIISQYGIDLVSEVDDEEEPSGLFEYYIGKDNFQELVFNHGANLYFITDRFNVYLMAFNEDDNKMISIYEIFIDGNKISKIGNL